MNAASQNEESMSFIVKVDAIVEDRHLDVDDVDVAGEYDRFLPPEARRWSEHDQAKAILDEFHESIPISVLDDFEISVFNDQGVEIFEDYDDED